MKGILNKEKELQAFARILDECEKTGSIVLGIKIINIDKHTSASIPSQAIVPLMISGVVPKEHFLKEMGTNPLTIFNEEMIHETFKKHNFGHTEN